MIVQVSTKTYHWIFFYRYSGILCWYQDICDMIIAVYRSKLNHNI